jgi:hypothetical protein
MAAGLKDFGCNAAGYGCNAAGYGCRLLL